ncbi:MAG: carbohydrate binding domain-containing protein, partial [Candidatus Eisenbacteria bacterium]
MKFPRLLHCIGAAILILTGMTESAHAEPSPLNAPENYPRLAFYGSIRGNGFPFYNAPLDSALNDTVITNVGRFNEVILDVNPIWPFRPDVVQALKAKNPRTKFLAYVVGQDIWMAADRDSFRHYPTRLRRIVTNNNAWLLSKRTRDKYFGGNINLAKRNAAGQLFIADSLALLWKEVTIDSGIWDGIFYDILCDEMGWLQADGDSVDYVAAGYPSFQAFNDSWKEATNMIGNKMRQWGGPGFVMVGNCALGTKYTTFNGWMREGFPYQAGGDWYSNMFWKPGGYITDEENFRAPLHNYIFSFQVGTDNYSDNNCRIARYGLGSATLASGYGVFGGQDRDAFHADYHNWWYDEYAVDLATGRGSESITNTGWLGQPLSDYYQMVWVGTEPEGVRNPDFETSVIDGWNLWTQIPGTRTRDTTTAGLGRSSVRVDIPTANAVNWMVNLNCPLDIPLEPFNSYSVTFWVKASTIRTLPVIIAPLGGSGSWFDRNVTVGTEWKHVQVPLYNTTREGAISLQFYVAKDAGSIWFDDVHVQKGTTTVYRRDFQNGSVLVNTSADQYSEVQMERPFR